MRRVGFLLAAFVALALVPAACGGDDETTEAGVTTVITTVEVTTTEPAATTAPTTTASEPPGPPFSTAPAQGEALSTRLALLTDVRLGRHEGYDRIVFEFLPGGRPGYRVRFVRPPIVEDASGNEVEVDGEAFLSIRLEPALGLRPRGKPRRGLHRPDADRRLERGHRDGRGARADGRLRGGAHLGSRPGRASAFPRAAPVRAAADRRRRQIRRLISRGRGR